MEISWMSEGAEPSSIGTYQGTPFEPPTTDAYFFGLFFLFCMTRLLYFKMFTERAVSFLVVQYALRVQLTKWVSWLKGFGLGELLMHVYTKENEYFGKWRRRLMWSFFCFKSNIMCLVCPSTLSISQFFYLDAFFRLSRVGIQPYKKQSVKMACVFFVGIASPLAHYLILGYENVVLIYVYYTIRIWLMSSMSKLLNDVAIWTRHLSQKICELANNGKIYMVCFNIYKRT